MNKLILFIILITPLFADDVPSLPFCPENFESGLVIVSTLDGRLSALNFNGTLIWEIDTGPGPLLMSNIHNMELTNNGEWIRIIPSLTGILYKFDGTTIDPIPISAEDLLKSSFLYSDDLVIAGGIEVRTYGVGFRTGTLFYECNSLRCSNNGTHDDDVLLVERSTRTIRAVEPRTGTERWNFSVGVHNIKLPRVTCINGDNRVDWSFNAVIPEGNLHVTLAQGNNKIQWNYLFGAPIVKIWKWNGKDLSELNIFSSENTQLLGNPAFPSIYIGMHLKQLYIHESSEMQTRVDNYLNGKVDTNMVVTESTSIVKIPWKPVSASSEKIEEDSTALSVLNGSEYVNGHGFFLYSHSTNSGSIFCSSNNSFIKNIKSETVSMSNAISSILISWWKEASLLIITLIICQFIFRYWNHQLKNQEIIIIEKPVEAQISLPDDKKETFLSRFENDFQTIRCLGKGGFGVVFEVKQKIDECNYAIKRITLPKEEKSRENVMREVKALAKLEHPNIIRYFYSWVEHPPVGWQQRHDINWIKEKFFDNTYSESEHSEIKRSKSVSVCIDIPLKLGGTHMSDDTEESDIESDNNDDDDDDEDDDSFIVFENPDNVDNDDDTKNNTYENVSTTNIQSSASEAVSLSKSKEPTDLMTDHLKKKINWKRPDRKHHSWDLSVSKNIPGLNTKEPPAYLYIQMQLCQQESLKEWLSSHRDRNYDQMRDMFLQILEAVEYVHLRGLIHRDLKPSNIFFSLDGQIKVGDFGLVKEVEDKFDLELIKKGNARAVHGHTLEVGTTLYMSPEQFRNRNYDYKVDIYSLGLILFELLVPFSTEMERIKMLMNVKKGKFPQHFQTKHPHEYDLLKNMLNTDPNKRLTTIGIKARPPFDMNISDYDEECHYRLNNVIKI